MKQSGVSLSSPGFAIPVQLSLIFIIELPDNVKESEVTTIVSTEARKYIPVPITEVSLDYFILPKKEMSFEEMNTEKTEVNNADSAQTTKEKVSALVVATQNDAITKYRSIITECNLTASFFEIEIFSSIRANFEHELSPILLMDFGASRTKLSIVEFGMVRSFHSVERGGGGITLFIFQSLLIPFP